MSKKIGILQLSDFHYGLPPHDKVSPIKEWLEEKQFKPQFIALTGDFCDKGGSPEDAEVQKKINLFKEQINGFIETPGLELKKETVLTCAGNHDFTRKNATAYHYTLKTLPSEAHKSLIVNRETHLNTFDIFHSILQSAGLQQADTFENLMYVKPMGPDGARVLFIVVNSSWLCNYNEPLDLSQFGNNNNEQGYQRFQQSNYNGVYCRKSDKTSFDSEFIKESEKIVSRLFDNQLMTLGHTKWLEDLIKRAVNEAQNCECVVLLMHHPVDSIAFYEKIKIANIPGGNFFRIIRSFSDMDKKVIVLSGHNHPDRPIPFEMQNILGIISGALYDVPPPKKQKSATSAEGEEIPNKPINPPYDPFALYHQIDLETETLNMQAIYFDKFGKKGEDADAVDYILNNSLRDRDFDNSGLEDLHWFKPDKDLKEKIKKVTCIRQYYHLKDNIRRKLTEQWVGECRSIDYLIDDKNGTDLYKKIDIFIHGDVVFDFLFPDDLEGNIATIERNKFVNSKISQILTAKPFNYYPVIMNVIPSLMLKTDDAEKGLYNEYLFQRMKFLHKEVTQNELKKLILINYSDFAGNIQQLIKGKLLDSKGGDGNKITRQFMLLTSPIFTLDDIIVPEN